MRPSEGVQQGQAAGISLLIAGLQGVVRRVELAQGLGDIAVQEGWVGGWIVEQVAAPVHVGTLKLTCRDSGILSGGCERQRRILLVGVDEALQMNAVIAHIGEVNLGVLAQAFLHIEEPALGVSVLVLGGMESTLSVPALKTVAR